VQYTCRSIATALTEASGFSRGSQIQCFDMLLDVRMGDSHQSLFATLYRVCD
jgi:hypothetical protein